MKTAIRFWALALVVALVQSAAADNPLPNPGFEEGEQHWTIGDEFSKITADAAHSGKLGVRVGATEYHPHVSSVTSSRLPVQEGQEIALTFWARSTKSSAGAYLFYYNADGKTVQDAKGKGGGPTCGITQPDGQWHPYKLAAKVPAGAASVAVWLHAFSGATVTTDFDDFAFQGIAADARPLPPPPKRAPRKEDPKAAAKLPPRTAPPVIILKLDDVKQVHGGVHAHWQRVADELKSRRIPGSFGVICETLAEATPKYVKWIKDRQESGEIEFWFHGYDHGVHRDDGTDYNEFMHRSYEEQKARVDKSQKLALKKLGFAFRTFGPPGGTYTGSFDAETLRVMHDDPYMRVWLYPQPLDEAGRKLAAQGKIVILDRVWEVNLESAVGMPDFARFAKGYALHPDRKHFVLQGHPAMWDDARFAEFGKILDFLVAQKAVFLTPTAYVATLGRPQAAK